MCAKYITCELHDYIELACLYGYRIRLELDPGPETDELLEGRALSTETSPLKEEYLLLTTAPGIQKIELKRIKTMRSVTPNPHFDLVRF